MMCLNTIPHALILRVGPVNTYHEPLPGAAAPRGDETRASGMAIFLGEMYHASVYIDAATRMPQRDAAFWSPRF